ncbi:unnamed protein product [Calypogeia fissa]
MGHPGCRTIMYKVAATLVVLLLIQDALVLCSPRFVVENFSSVTGIRRSLSESNDPQTVAVDLMHVQHADSPYKKPNLTALQRVQSSSKSSKQRLNYFSGKIIGNKKIFGVSHVVSSPVISEQGQYVMQISAGTPSRTFKAFVDTGSDLIWLQCKPCTYCYPEPDPLYDPTASSSYMPMSCNATLCTDLPNPFCSANNTCFYTYNYGDGSFTKGSMAFETFSLPSTTGSQKAFTSVGFGCGNDNEGNNRGFDGLVGLGKGPLSLVSQLGTNIVPVFSYCLVSFASATNRTSPLLLGSAGSLKLSYTPLTANRFHPTFYYVNLVGITVNNQRVAYPNGTFTIDPTDGYGGLLLDSGTTITQLFDAAYTPFKAAMSAAISYPPLGGIDGFDLCYDTSTVASPVFPAVVFKLDKVDLAMPSDNIFLPVDTLGLIYCMFIAQAGVNSAISIFGNVQQQNFQIAFDIVNAQVGFAHTTC